MFDKKIFWKERYDVRKLKKNPQKILRFKKAYGLKISEGHFQTSATLNFSELGLNTRNISFDFFFLKVKYLGFYKWFAFQPKKNSCPKRPFFKFTLKSVHVTYLNVI